VSELQDMLRVQARLHRKQGANALGDLFQSAALEIEILTERLENPQGLQELICVEQMKEISLPEIHRANQKLHEQLAKANERESVLSCQLDSHIERVAELEKENRRESMELRSRLGSALGRNSEYNSTIENMQQKLAKANERVKELEVLAEERAEFIINASNMASANEVYKRCKFPLKVAINKFATEKKIDGVQLVIDALASKGMLDTLISFVINSVVEQLRKEQEHV